MEEWRAVVGWEGLYEVSDHGRVRSLAHGGGTGGQYRRSGPRIKSPSKRNGYPYVSLHDKPRRSTCVFVVDAFLGGLPAGMDTRHLDGSRDNNHVSNLSIGTRKENMEDARRHGTLPVARGERNGRTSLTVATVQLIRSEQGTGKTQSEVAATFGVSKATIGSIWRRYTWGHIPYAANHTAKQP